MYLQTFHYEKPANVLSEVKAYMTCIENRFPFPILARDILSGGGFTHSLYLDARLSGFACKDASRLK
jgi:hypothetical protein